MYRKSLKKLKETGDVLSDANDQKELSVQRLAERDEKMMLPEQKFSKQVTQRKAAERVAAEAENIAKELEAMYTKELKKREELEQVLSGFKDYANKICEEKDILAKKTQKLNRQIELSDQRLADADEKMKSVEQKLSKQVSLRTDSNREAAEAKNKAKELEAMYRRELKEKNELSEDLYEAQVYANKICHEKDQLAIANEELSYQKQLFLQRLAEADEQMNQLEQSMCEQRRRLRAAEKREATENDLTYYVHDNMFYFPNNVLNAMTNSSEGKVYEIKMRKDQFAIENQKLKSQKELLEQRLAEADEKVKLLEQNLSNYSSLRAASQRETENKAKEVEAMYGKELRKRRESNHNLSEANNDINKICKEKDKFAIETRKLISQKELLKLISQKELLVQRLGEADEKIKLLEQKLSKQAKEVGAELRKREELDHNLSESNKYINKLFKEKDHFDLKAQKLKSQNELSMQRVAEADEKIKLFEQELSEQVKLLAAANREAGEAENKAKELKIMYAEELKIMYAEEFKKREELEQAVSKEREQVNKICNERDHLGKKLNAEKELLEQQLAEAEEKINLVEQKLSKQAKEVEAELSKREKSDHNLSEAYEFINKLLQRVAEADEGIKLYEQKFCKLSKLLGTKREADEEIKLLEHKLSEQVELLAAANREAGEADEEIKLLEHKLSEQVELLAAANREAGEAKNKAAELKRMYTEEFKKREELEQAVSKEREQLNKICKERDNLDKKLDAEKELSVQRLAEAGAKMKQLEKKFLSSMELVFQYRSELQAGCEKTIPVNGLVYEFTESEIFESTNNFDSSLIIGRGAYGTTYCSFLRQIQVAIKVRDPNNVRGVSEFHQEVAISGRVRHPNVVTLIGTCPSNESLVYEFLPYGSLEDRLNCKDKTLPLTWAARLRIAADLCSGLLFLHSSKDHCIVHGDLKPSNVLLGANFVPKMSDFGVSRLIRCRTVREMAKIPWEADAYPHVDPEFGCSGHLTAESDVYSFGVLLLRLLTNRQPLGLPREVMKGREANELMKMVDSSAGEWPFVVADQIAEMAVRCCAPKREDRADLQTGVWSVLKGMRAFYADMESCPADDETAPAYFVCPIFQDVMEDPHVAADGFTYDAEAVKGWFEGGHNTSPMTNLKLPHCNLVPNRSLRSAIQEWVQRR